MDHPRFSSTDMYISTRFVLDRVLENWGEWDEGVTDRAKERDGGMKGMESQILTAIKEQGIWF